MITEAQKDSLRILSMTTTTAGAFLDLIKGGEHPPEGPVPIELDRAPKACAWIDLEKGKVLGRTKQGHLWEIDPDGSVRLMHGEQRASFAWISKVRQDLRRAKIRFFEEVAPDSKKVRAIWELVLKEEPPVNAKFEDLISEMGANDIAREAIKKFISIPKPSWTNWVETRERIG